MTNGRVLVPHAQQAWLFYNELYRVSAVGLLARKGASLSLRGAARRLSSIASRFPSLHQFKRRYVRHIRRY